jgi:hypothetical protein
MQRKWIITLFLVLGLLVFLIPTAYAVEGSFPIGSGGQTQDKPQSKLWFNAGTWWAIMSDGTDVYFYKLANGLFVKQTFPDAMVDAENAARADVLWDGTHLFVLMYRNSTGRLSKYSYNGATKTYTRLPNFPVTLSLASGTESAVIEKDSTGKLWIAYDPGNEIRVIWSTNPEHTSWNTMGMALASVDEDDIAAIVAFNNRIGVMWSNQRSDSDNFGFRLHVDGASDTTWGPVEIVEQGGDIADDHINLAVTPTQDVIAITKSSDGPNEINLFVRWHDSNTWDGPYFVADHATRPIVVFDRDNQDVYVFYTDWSISTQQGKVSYNMAPLSDLTEFSNRIEFIVVPGGNLNDVTSTKQAVDASTGLLVMAKSGSEAYYKLLEIVPSGTPPVNHAPVVNAGPDQTLTTTTASLNGSLTDTTIPAGGALTATWSGPAGVTFGNLHAAVTTASFPGAGTYVLRLTGSDGARSAFDELTVTVAPAGALRVVETRVAAKTDDAEEKNSGGSMDLTSGNVDLGTKPAGLRFLLPVPHGAQIVRAYVQFTADTPQTGAAALMIEGEASDNAPPFGSSEHNIVNRLRTFNHVSWTPAGWPTKGTAGLAQQTPDLSVLLQEIVDRQGWASGQGVALLVTGTGVRQAVSYDTKPATAALLHVEYVLP